MSFYTNMAATADRLLKQYGMATTLKRTSNGAYDPSTGTTTPTQTIVPIVAAVFDFDQHFINGTEILSGDKQVFVSAVGVSAPLAGDVLAWNGMDYVVIKVKPLAPAGVDVMHELQVRR